MRNILPTCALPSELTCQISMLKRQTQTITQNRDVRGKAHTWGNQSNSIRIYYLWKKSIGWILPSNHFKNYACQWEASSVFKQQSLGKSWAEFSFSQLCAHTQSRWRKVSKLPASHISSGARHYEYCLIQLLLKSIKALHWRPWETENNTLHAWRVCEWRKTDSILPLWFSWCLKIRIIKCNYSSMNSWSAYLA